MLKGKGKLLGGFTNFWNYSFRNQLLAQWQMIERGLQVSPIATYKKWASLGRQVQKGSKALYLYMPVTVTENKGTADEKKKTIFVPKNNWFAMSQTEGDAEVEFPKIGYDWDKALTTLDIKKEKFAKVNGNVQGYATPKRTIAVNPLATQDVDGTIFHELGHILLGHLDKETMFDDLFDDTKKSLKEVEAEGVALCCKLALGLGDTEFQVGYINNWWKHSEIPVDSIKKIFKITDQILKAGQEKPAVEGE